jgi:hypothetical protein
MLREGNVLDKLPCIPFINFTKVVATGEKKRIMSMPEIIE